MGILAKIITFIGLGPLRKLLQERQQCMQAGLHNSFHPTIRDGSTWSKFGAHGEYGDVFLLSNLGAL